MGPTPLPGRWRDLSARVRGPSVADIATIFRADWAFAAGETVPEPAVVDASASGDVMVQVVGSGPDSESDTIYDAFLSSVFTAQRRLWITTPYFVPDEGLFRGIALAVRRGVDVCIIVPLRSNHLTADLAGAEYLREIQKVGGRVRCYEPGMMHAKLVLVDDEVGILGSANMDMRSFFLDYEIALFISAEREIEAMATWLTGLLESCVDLPRPGPLRRWVESVARLLAPLE
jgi:cardiolipin synthase